MTTKRRYGAGTVTRRSADTWQLRVSIGRDPLSGEYRRATKTVKASSPSAARRLLAEFLTESHGRRQQETFGGMLAEYLDMRTGMSPSTRADFESYLARSLTPHLRNTKLRDLTTYQLDALYRHLEREGGVCRRRGVDSVTGLSRKCSTATCKHGAGGPLAASTVRKVHTIIHAALEQAVRWQYLADSPARYVTLPDVEHHEVVLPPAEHLVRLLAGIDELTADAPNAGGSPLPDFTALLLATGARPGELCALPWGDVDLEAAVDEAGRPIGRLTIDQSVARAKGGAVVKTTKTNRGRGVYIDADVTAVLAARLVRWRPAVLVAGVPLEQFPVFPSKGRGERPWRPDSMGREFRAVRDRLALSDDLTLRNLRHYCVSVLAAAGVDVVTIAKRMGHSPQIMLGVYAHLFAQGDIAAAGQLGAHNAGLRGAH